MIYCSVFLSRGAWKHYGEMYLCAHAYRVIHGGLPWVIQLYEHQEIAKRGKLTIQDGGKSISERTQGRINIE